MSDPDFITRQSEIPEAPYYVVMDDTFMSGWGPAAGKINTLVFLCKTTKEADAVYFNGLARKEMRRVRVVTEKPRLVRGHLYQIKTRGNYSHWYESGAFRER